MPQKTISQPVVFEGPGIHTGQTASVKINPAPDNHGIVFVRTDLPEQPRIPALADFIDFQDRQTSIKNQGARIQTVEHLLAALMVMGISNVSIEINAEELPIMDGSARPIFHMLQEAGITEQNKPVRPLELKNPIFVENGTGTLVALPANKFEVFCFLDFPGTAIGRQTAVYNDSEKFLEEIAPARTFGFWHEIEVLRSRGLAQGGSLENAVIVGDKAYSTPLRFPDEPARHKILDIIGDLALLGQPLLARIIALKPGHALNCQLLRKIAAQTE